jgi:glutamyl-tRNA synthetase
MPRVRFAPSPTGFLHIGSARTYIFNWLYARHNSGTMILRIDDTDVGRNTDASLTSIFDGLRWLDLGWDEEYKQSDRLALHREVAEAIFEKGLAYRDFTAAQGGDSEKSGAQGTWLCNAGMRELSREESDRRAAAGEPFALRFRVPHDRQGQVQFADAVYGDQAKAYADIEDFALLRSDGMPTYHLANCADDAGLRITHIIRGQEHLSNAFKHKLIFDAAGAESPTFAHLPLLMAPDGMKLSKRVHGPVVSVTTYRDAGFLPEAFINFLCLLGWSPKNDREKLSRQETVELFTLEGINRANAVVNFTEEDPFDAKALWLNAEHIRSLPTEELARDLLPFVPPGTDQTDMDFRRTLPEIRCQSGLSPVPGTAAAPANLETLRRIAPLIQERMKLLRDVRSVADFFFAEQLPPYDSAELIPKKGDAAMAKTVLLKAREVLATAEFSHDGLEAALRAASVSLGVKAGQMFEPVRVAVCGRKTAPPLFGTLEVLGRETCLARIGEAIQKL